MNYGATANPIVDMVSGEIGMEPHPSTALAVVSPVAYAATFTAAADMQSRCGLFFRG